MAGIANFLKSNTETGSSKKKLPKQQFNMCG
jgi:hypothetical protein